MRQVVGWGWGGGGGGGGGVDLVYVLYRRAGVMQAIATGGYNED